MDGTDLRQITDPALRREAVLVTQENFLFSGSVRENIALGRPGARAAQIEQAARATGAHGFIRDLPGGYDADIGKRGSRLSAGQRQLISFARAYLAAPSVLVLDEATSLLDVPAERQVQAALRTILAGRTAVIIAHRLSTVEIAGRVPVLDRGRVAGDGPPAESLASARRYTALHANCRQHSADAGSGGQPPARGATGGKLAAAGTRPLPGRRQVRSCEWRRTLWRLTTSRAGPSAAGSAGHAGRCTAGTRYATH